MSDHTNLHETTDCLVWENAFMATFPNCGIPEGTMIGWFANAMMAKADEIARADLPRPQDAARIAELEKALSEVTHPDFIFGALDNVYDMDVSLTEFAAAASRAIRAMVEYAK